MPDLRAFALDLISKNPQVANNPLAQQMIEAIKSGDNQKGEQIASNLCEAHGVSKEEATGMAKKFFGF